MEKVVAYYRTSSGTNVGVDKDSFKRQQKACVEFCRAAGLEIDKEFYDANVPGRDPIGSRQGYSSLIEFCFKTGISKIVFENASRFARDQVVQELGYRELRKKGFELICADAPDYFSDDTANPSQKMIRQILGAVSEFEKDALVLKLKSARERKKRINKQRGVRTLKGEGKVEGRKSYSERDPNLIKEARRLARRNPKTKKRRSLRSIASELSRLGHQTAKGTNFSASQVARLLG